MKKFVLGFVCGALLFTAIGVWAAQYNIEPNPFKILVDGQEKQMEGYNINGYSYFKLRDIGEATRFDVDFKEDTILISNEQTTDNNAAATDIPEWARDIPEFSIYRDENGIVYASYGEFEYKGILKKTGIEADPIGNKQYNMVLYNKGGNRWFDKDYDHRYAPEWIPIKENIPYIYIEGYPYISLDYFEKEILPLDEALR